MRFAPHPAESPFVKSDVDPQAAHDALVGLKPIGVEHAHCELCPDPVKETKQEVALVAGEDRTYAEAEHLALMADAVKRENADLTAAKDSAETKVSELSTKVDVLEGEKASLITEKDTVQADFDTYKATVERAREVEAAKNDRLEKVKAANTQLPDSYFTPERVQRWAEMAEDAFVSFVEDITFVAGSGPAKETAAFSGGIAPTQAGASVSAGSIFAARRGEKK